ncbi:hypothetical protein AAF712_000040 [Marasmius tenuissimus]|uniref:Uncharacterized protein n=1 Tax=Marasmius tenuissimus TaxID=585030 RepID=A0ABR3AFC8_9AGAR
MRFPLFRRLSHLISRRPKSESFATDVLRQLAHDIADEEERQEHSRSRSLDDSTDNRIPFILPPHLLDILPQNPIPSSFKDILIVLANLEQRIPVLESENAQLKQDSNRIAFESQLCEKELSLKNAQVVRQRSHLAQLQQEVKQAQNRLDDERADNCALEDFLSKALASYPPGHIFHRIATAIDAGSTFESAIVNVIRQEIDANPSSPWSKLVPAVVGPRTPDQYAAALSVVLKARKELAHGKNISHYWKRQAKMDDTNAGVITPSSSVLSDVQESLTEERQRAANDLLRKLRSGEIPVRSRVVTQAAIVEEDGSEASSTIPSSPLQDSIPVCSASLEEPLEDIAEDFTRLSTVTAPPLSAKSLSSLFSPMQPSERPDIPIPINNFNPMPPSSTTRSLAAAVSISSVSSSSLSSFASTDLSDVWEFVNPPPNSRSLAKNTNSNTPCPQDAGGVSPDPIPPVPPRPLRPTPRISPFNGLETINETEEPSSASSSSNCLSSIPSSSVASGSLPDATLVETSTQNDATLVMDDRPVLDGAQVALVGSPVKRAVLAEEAESPVKQPKSPMLRAMSKLPRRLSLSLKKPSKEKETEIVREKGKENSSKESKSLPVIRRPRPALTSLKIQSPTAPASVPPKKSQPPLREPARLKARTQANRGASARPTISSQLKQTSTPPRRKGVNNGNIRDLDGCGSPSKPRGKKAILSIGHGGAYRVGKKSLA